MGLFEAASSAMARNRAYNTFPQIGKAGRCDEHRVMKGQIVYEYDNGALCVRLIQEACQ